MLESYDKIKPTKLKQFKASVDALHMCSTEEEYHRELAAFVEKYKRSERFNELFEYFETFSY